MNKTLRFYKIIRKKQVAVLHIFLQNGYFSLFSFYFFKRYFFSGFSCGSPLTNSYQQFKQIRICIQIFQVDILIGIHHITVGIRKYVLF